MATQARKTNVGLGLESRRAKLGMPVNVLATRSGLGRPMVSRILNGHTPNPSSDTLIALADALGVRVSLGGAEGIRIVELSSALDFCEAAANRKAERIVSLVQGTSALEAQAVGSEDYRQMVRQTVHDLMANRRKVWA